VTIMKRVLLVTLIFLVLAAGFIVWDIGLVRNSAKKPGDLIIGLNDEMTQNTLEAGTQTENSGDVDSAVGLFGNNLEQLGEDEQVNNDAAAKSILTSKSISVVGNTPEYDMKVTLCQAADLKPFIRFEYFINGISVVNELDEKQVPEISGILESTSSQQDDINTQSIQQLLLNPMYGQLYMLISNKPEIEGSQATLYRINLSDMAVDKLFSYAAIYGRMVFNKDYSLLAYSFMDSPNMSAYQEDSLLAVYDCKAGEYIVKANRDANMQLIGTNRSPDLLYDYEFLSWNSLDTLRLKQGTRRMTDLDKKPLETEVLYDIMKNVLLNLDGSLLKQVEGQDAADTDDAEGTDSAAIEAHKDDNIDENSDSSGSKDVSDSDSSGKDGNQPDNKAIDSEPVKVLKSFYSYLQSKDQYRKAMDLLDDDFKLRMAMLRQFGVQEISKGDIDAGYDEENVSLFSDLLKAAKLDTITEETKLQDDTVVITYYHIFGISADSQIRQPMSAKIVKSQKVWEIVLIEDGV